jgi:pilus assembly protein FimV
MLVLALSMAFAPAHAVDVDRIEIHSRLGEPLLAEIPITGASPQELEQLKAQLASATTFARIGLPRPSGVVADLRFEVVRGPRPLIRVTSSVPVQEEFLTFLLQVEAPQGRLVREYSLALGAAPSLPAALPPQIQAPATAEGNAIARPPPAVQDPADALPAPVELATQHALSPAPVPLTPPSPEPIPLQGERPRATAPTAPTAPAPARVAAPPRPAPTKPGTVRTAAPVARTNPARASAPPAAAPSARPRTTRAGSGDYVVQRGDNLSRVVERMDFRDATPQQAMLALLRTNPQAFGSGNINLLRQGAVLQRPSSAELDRLDQAAAEAMVQLQIQQWRSGEMPPVVPEATAQPTPAVAAESAAQARIDAPKVAPARLEIAPATEADAVQAATGAGQAAGRDATARERAAADLVATRYTEFQQMQQRIAELEQAQKAQQRLLELKDRQLAAQRPQSAGIWPWLIAALAVLIAAGTVWHRRRAEKPGRVARRLASMVGARRHEATSSSTT